MSYPLGDGPVGRRVAVLLCSVQNGPAGGAGRQAGCAAQAAHAAARLALTLTRISPHRFSGRRQLAIFETQVLCSILKQAWWSTCALCRELGAQRAPGGLSRMFPLQPSLINGGNGGNGEREEEETILEMKRLSDCCDDGVWFDMAGAVHINHCLATIKRYLRYHVFSALGLCLTLQIDVVVWIDSARPDILLQNCARFTTLVHYDHGSYRLNPPVWFKDGHFYFLTKQLQKYCFVDTVQWAQLGIVFSEGKNNANIDPLQRIDTLTLKYSLVTDRTVQLKIAEFAGFPL